jgi:hypothetical protein
MIKVSVFYENTEGKKFDMVYYINNHIPMVIEKRQCLQRWGS